METYSVVEKRILALLEQLKPEMTKDERARLLANLAGKLSSPDSSWMMHVPRRRG